MKKPEECCDVVGPLTDAIIDASMHDVNTAVHTLHHRYQIGIPAVCRLLLISGAGIAISHGCDIDWLAKEMAEATAQAVAVAERHLKIRVE